VHIGVANSAPRFKMKLRHESAADESDSEFSVHVNLEYIMRADFFPATRKNSQQRLKNLTISTKLRWA
jgi:hypothetical protein